MKKILIALLAVLMLTACSAGKAEEPQQPVENNTDVKEEEPLVGGWTINDSLPEMDDAIFNNARQKLLGVSYSPLFAIGYQVSADQNIMYLAYGTTVTPDAKPQFKIVTVFDDLNNNHESEILNVDDFDVMDYLEGEGTNTPEGLMGGWQDATNLPNMLSADENAVFEKALEGLTGVGYSPVAVLARQVVAGTNYAFLAMGTSVTAEPITHLYVINVYADLNGGAELKNIHGIDLSSFQVEK